MSFQSPFSNAFTKPNQHKFNRRNQNPGRSYTPDFLLNNMGIVRTRDQGATTVNTRASASMTLSYEGLYVATEPGEISLEGARREKNIATSLSTQTIAVEVGREYQISCTGGDGATVVASNAATGTLTNNGTDRHAFDTALTASTTSLTLTITGTLTALQVEDVTGRITIAPSESILGTEDYGYGVDGVIYYSATNGNTVKGGIVTEAQGYKFVANGGRKEQNDLFSQQDISTWAKSAGVTTVQNADGSWRVTLPAGGTIATSSDLATPSVTYNAGRELVTAVAMKLL